MRSLSIPLWLAPTVADEGVAPGFRDPKSLLKTRKLHLFSRICVDQSWPLADDGAVAAKRAARELTPAFGYIRVSGLGQADGDGPVRQRQAIERFAAREGFEIKGWYSDLGVTGKSDWEDREQFTTMLEALNGTRTIIVEKMDRLARAVLVQELILRDLKKRDVRLLSAAGDDSADEQPERVMFRQMLGVFAEYERASIVLKLRAARKRKKLATGRCEGRKPFGQKLGEQATIATMRAMRESGMAIEAIAAKLNETGTPTRMAGKRWHPTMVSRVLRKAS